MTHRPVTHRPAALRRYGTGTDLWRAIAAPVVWLVHFLICYVHAAIHCQKAGRGADLGPVAWVVAAVTLAALLVITGITLSLWRVRGRSLTDDDFEFEHNSAEERHRFLSHVALMLCVLSAVAVIFTALPTLYLTSCR